MAPGMSEQQRPEMSLKQLMLAFGMGVIASCIVIYMAVTHRTPTEADFELVEATPASVTMLHSGKKPYVEIRLPDDPIRYRIPVEMFGDFTDKAGFVYAAREPGARLAFHIERGARQNPELPRADPKPTVFIETVRVNKRPFYTLTDRIRWKENNAMWARILAFVFPLMTAYVGLVLWGRRDEFERLRAKA